MALSTMQSMVLTTIILITLTLIVSHELNRNSYTDIWEDPALKNLTSTLETLFAVNISAFDNNAPAQLQTLNFTIANGSLTLNRTLESSPTSLFPEEPPFYLSSFPKAVFLYALLVPLQYYWHIALERLFPARSRAGEVYGQQGKEKAFDGDENRDEEAVKRLVAQGRVRRASLSWRNTFFKWVLNLTLNRLGYEFFFHLADGIVTRTLTLDNLKQRVITDSLMSFISLGPVASLIGFIAIPAYQRVVFMAGVDFVEAIFFSLFWQIVLPWLLKTDLVQRTLVDSTANIFKSAQGDLTGHVIDEL